MTVGPGRFRIRRAGSPGAASASEGLVVQAVLLMAMVTTIGILVVAARVAGSRQSATAATLSNTARQAAEYGFSETVAEMNRDSKSYLWVIDSANWNSVSEQDLINSGVASTNAPSSNPIPGVVSNVELPQSPGLSYRIISYKAPCFVDAATSPSPPCRISGTFGNLIGGSGEITIEGTLNRGAGSITTYRLKRTVSVKRAAPIFNNPITAIPTSRGRFNPADSRFPPFRVVPVIPSYALTCQPQVNSANVASTSIIECTAVPSSFGSTLTQNFKSATATPVTAPGLDDFPFVVGSPGPWTPCRKDPGDKPVQCLFTSITVRANPANSTVNVDMLVKTDTFPVEIFLMNNMTIESGSKLSGDKDNWSGFRIFGNSPSTSCAPPSQTITINSLSNSAATPPTVGPNLQNVFLWLKAGELKLESTAQALTTSKGLIGSVCKTSNILADGISSDISSRKFFEGLGGAYAFKGIFGAPMPGDPPRIRFFYRGFGFSEQSISTQSISP